MTFAKKAALESHVLQIVRNDPWLEPVKDDIFNRYSRYCNKLEWIESEYGSLLQFADSYKYLGIHFDETAGGWWYREYAPAARDLFLFGDFNHWQRTELRLQKGQFGVWELFLPFDKYKDRFIHGSKVKVLVHGENGWHERIPVYSTRVVQDDTTKDFSAQLWFPKPFSWDGDLFHTKQVSSDLLIYECHIGMAQEAERVGTYTEFREKILPYIYKAGYNALQIMAIAEHPYYGSFGYHVSNFFAASSRFGTPEELKCLIKEAHSMGMAVIMDIVHSHTVKNFNEGINEFDGSPSGGYLHAGAKGYHNVWDSRLFDYGRTETVQFLLSNIKYWMDEFRFDGFRFDGVTSMLYTHHGFIDEWSRERYFGNDVDADAITYLQLANTLIHRINPEALSISEDVSGMPGTTVPVEEGGLGFDYRLGMGIPDYWIRMLEKPVESWSIGEMWNTLLNRTPYTKTIAYAESHDQAMVGDKTIAFRLMDTAMYWHMGISDNNIVVASGMAFHKMIRLITIALGGEAYLNFMGNEFGHPEWIDFPRKDNNWSYLYARRQWSLAENKDLRYKFLAAFDRDMLKLEKQRRIMGAALPVLLNIDECNKTLIFERAGLVFVFNWHHSQSIAGYHFTVPEHGTYRIIFNSDDIRYGGFDRVNSRMSYRTWDMNGQPRLSIYNVNHTALVLEKTDPD